MKTEVLFILALMILIISGCETDPDKSVTGAYLYRNPGKLKTIAVTPDSLKMGNNFRHEIGYYPYMLAGRYNNIEAGSVIKFSMSDVQFDSLIGASLRFDVRNLWQDGAIEFALYKTHSDWSDTTSLDYGLFHPEPGDLTSLFSSDTDDITTLTFEIDSTFVWSSDTVSFLMKSAGSGASMVSLLSYETTSPPCLLLSMQTASGDIDTTRVYSQEDTYYILTNHDEDEHVLSEGDASGFILNIGIPESIHSLAAVNRCIIKLNALDRIIPEEPMNVSINRLTEKFTAIDSVVISKVDVIYLEIQSDKETYELDVTSFVNSWHTGGETNFGLLFKPTGDDVSPNQCVFATGDSLRITYTGLPEVE